MSFLVNLKIGSRLAMGFAISVGLVCVIGAMAIWQIGKVYQKTEEISGAILPTVQTLSDVRSTANTVRRTTLRGLLEADQPGRDAQRGGRLGDFPEKRSAIAGGSRSGQNRCA